MKRFIALLVCIPCLSFAAYTEFYCDATNGNNLWAGSSTSTSPYTKTAGNWAQATKVYTVQDGTNPSSSVSVGDFASVYPDGTSAPAVFIARVSAVQNATNGTITLNAGIEAGTNPTNGTGNRTIVVGGVWKGPNAASGFPFSITGGIGSLINTNGDQTRVNMKNNSTYSVTSSFAYTGSGGRLITQGYSSSVGDGGKATIDGGTSTGALITSGLSGNVYTDIIFTTSITTGTNQLVSVSSSGAIFNRCVFKGARTQCLNIGANSTVNECELYDCNKSNSLNSPALDSAGGFVLRTVIHDNSAGSNCDGIRISGGATRIQKCIIDTNAGRGIVISSNGAEQVNISETDFYNNSSDGIQLTSTSSVGLWVENSNFIKNGGAGINNLAAASGKVTGFVYNCGYGAGTQANTNADTLGNLDKSGTVTYDSNVTPWVDPANGDFNINLAAAQGAGRGAFLETQGYSSPNTVGYPDIAAAQAQIGQPFPTPTATPTVTPTPTTPPETSHTFGG